jgi:putative ABC transport system permease protein
MTTRRRRARLPMMARVVLASVWYRRARLGMAAFAVVLGCSLPAALLGLGAVRHDFQRDLAAHGANLVVVPAHGTTLDNRVLVPFARLVADGRLLGYAPRLALFATVGTRRIAVTGMQFTNERALHPWWRVAGAWPEAADEVLLGANAAAKLAQAPGDWLTVATAHGTREFRVAGVFTSEGPEDDQLLVGLDAARVLAARPRGLTLVHGRAPAIDGTLAVAAALAQSIPDADVRTPLQAVKTSETVLRRLERLLGLVTLLVLVASVLAVFSTMAATAVERAHEVGVMKALGADDGSIRALASAEACALGLMAGVLGFILGLALTEAIAWQVFGVLVRPSPLAALASVVVGLGVTIGASLAPIHRLVQLGPAAVLRGE